MRFPVTMVLVWAGCGPGSVSIPEVPNLASTVALFEQPTGTVPVEEASEQMAEAGQRLDTLESTRLGDLLADGLGSLRDRLQANRLSATPEMPPDPDKPEVDGYLRVHRICKGWNNASTTPDAANGTLDLLAVVRDRELQRAVSVTASACKGRVQVGEAPAFVHPFVDGNLVLALEGPLVGNAAETRAVVQLDATLGTEMRTAPRSFAFRILSGGLEVAVPVNDGQIVVTRDKNGFLMRGSNGSFICSIETGTCQ